MSSILGCVAAVTAIVSPSQLSPAVIQRMSISGIEPESHRVTPLLEGTSAMFSSALKRLQSDYASEPNRRATRSVSSTSGEGPSADSNQLLRLPPCIERGPPLRFSRSAGLPEERTNDSRVAGEGLVVAGKRLVSEVSAIER